MITPDVARAGPVQPSAVRPAQVEAEAADVPFADLVELDSPRAGTTTADPCPETAAPPDAPAPAPAPAPLLLAAAILPQAATAGGETPADGETAPAAPAPAAVPAAASPAVPAAPAALAAPATPAAPAAPAAATAPAGPAAALRDEADAVAEVEAGPRAESAAAKDVRAAPAAAEARPVSPAAPVFVDAPRAEAPAWRLAAHAPHRAAVAAAPREVTAQLALAVGQSGDGQVDVRLDPPELGRVQIRLHATESGGLQAIVLADRPETQDFLRRHAEALVRDLGEAGYAEVSLEFAAGRDAPERDAPDTASTLAWRPNPADAPTAPAARHTPDAAGLDIRL